MIAFVTTNTEKVYFAKRSLAPYSVDIDPVSLELEEIQSQDFHPIIVHKLKNAFRTLQRPLLVSDHFWKFTGLNGFPGAYMKDINQWLEPDDLLALLKGKKDRGAILTEAIGFSDGVHEKIFVEHIDGTILHSPEGKGLPGQQIISLSNDGHSIAYHLEKGTDPRGNMTRKVWDDFAKWYNENS